MPVPVPARLRRAPGAAARALASLGLVLILTACELDPTAAPPAPTRTPQPPPALSPIATSQGQTPAGTPGTPGATVTTAPGAPSPSPNRTTTPAPGSTPDRTSTPAPGSTAAVATTGPGTPTLAPGASTTTPQPATTPQGGSTPRPGGTLELVSHSGAVQGSEYVVSGQVLNGTSSSLPAVRVAGTVYDREGREVDTAEMALTGDGPFRPGEQRPFTLRFRSDGRVVRYYVDIEAR
ncbi:MAG TPA: FxLYD domain-containing protein [Chloroflexota bacterium]|nr:FxLYD domain-containing protein [Chloroflexota bacterium]